MRKLSAYGPLFESYTELDKPIVRTASNFQLYLIGGTAIDMLCNYYCVDNNRNRSNNDIDFLSFATDIFKTKDFVHQLVISYDFKIDIESDYMITLVNNNRGIDVDILIDHGTKDSRYCMTVNNVLVMSPCYIIYNKLDRYLSTTNEERKKIDIADIETLLKIADKIGESEFSKLESLIYFSPRNNTMINVLNGIIEKLL